MFVGSANLTATGLNYHGSGNLEILCEPATSFDHLAFEAGLIEMSREVSDNEILLWDALGAVLPHESIVSPAGEGVTNSWRPSTRDPEHVWLLYCDLPSRIVSEDEGRLARIDLDALAVPKGLARHDFDVWVGTQLLASPFAESVMNAEDAEESVLWTRLAELWQIPEGEAARSIETTRSWVTTYVAR